jgi:hypothetical protein
MPAARARCGGMVFRCGREDPAPTPWTALPGIALRIDARDARTAHTARTARTVSQCAPAHIAGAVRRYDPYAAPSPPAMHACGALWGIEVAELGARRSQKFLISRS